jgi:hypothetical protein
MIEWAQQQTALATLIGDIATGEASTLPGLSDRHDLPFQDDAVVAVNCASDPVLRLATDQRKQPHDDMRPTWKQRMQSAGRGHYRLLHLEAMVRHGA